MMPFAFALYLMAATAPDTCPVVTEAPKAKSYVYRVLVSLNQQLNTLTGGEPDETLSSRWGRNRKKGKFARAACWVLDRFQRCHCATSIERAPDGAPLAHQLHQ
jgi:hypothetical protein